MLMISADRGLDPHAAGWVVRTIIDGVRASTADVVVGESLADRVLAAAPHRATVVAVDASEEEGVQRSTAAAAAGVVWVTAGSGFGLRGRLHLSTGSATKVPLALVVMSDHAVDAAEVRMLAGAQVVRAVPPAPPDAQNGRCAAWVVRWDRWRLRRNAWTAPTGPHAESPRRPRPPVDCGSCWVRTMWRSFRSGAASRWLSSSPTASARAARLHPERRRTDRGVPVPRFLLRRAAPALRRARPPTRHPHRRPLAPARRGLRVLTTDPGAEEQPGRPAQSRGTGSLQRSARRCAGGGCSRRCAG